MMKQRSLKFNFAMNSILTMSSFIFPLITFPYVSRILLPVGTGKVAFATSLISYFTMFAQLGIPMYGIRACARVRDDREKLTQTVQELLLINLLMCVLSYTVLAVVLVRIPKFSEDRLLYIVVSANILLNALGMEWLYKAVEQYAYITFRSIVFKLLSLVAMILLIHEQKDYVLYGGITVLAGSASYICNFLNVGKYIDLKPVGNYRLKRHLKAVGVFFAMSCATTVYTHLDTIMLGLMTSDADVGYYNAAVKIRTVLLSIITSVGTVLLPRVSYYIEQGRKDEFKRVSRKALHLIILMSLPLTIYFIMYAKAGISFLSGRAFENAIVPMRIIMPTILLVGITNVTGIQILIPQGREKVVLYSEIAGAIIDLGLNMILIPRFASAGAALGTLAAEIVVLLVQFAALGREALSIAGSIPYFKVICATILGSIVSTAGCFALGTVFENVIAIQFELGYFIEMVISAVLFFGVYLFCLLWMKEPLAEEIKDTVISQIFVRGRRKWMD